MKDADRLATDGDDIIGLARVPGERIVGVLIAAPFVTDWEVIPTADPERCIIAVPLEALPIMAEGIPPHMAVQPLFVYAARLIRQALNSGKL